MKTVTSGDGHSSAGTLIGMLVFAIAPLAVGIGLLAMRHYSTNTRDAARTWHQTQCVVEVCEFESIDDGRALTFVFRYVVDGKEYRSHQLDTIVGRFGDDDIFEESVHESFPPGAETVCFVNPADPAQAVFRRDRGDDAPRRMFLLAFPFLTIGLIFSGMLIAVAVTPDTRRDADAKASLSEGAIFQAPPPRAIPLAARVAVFAGPLGSQIAWFFLVGFVFIFVIMDGPASWSRLFRVTSDEETVIGHVTDVRRLASHELSIPVYQYQIEYEAAGRTHRSNSYTRGQRYGNEDEVPVVFDIARPEQGAIVGARPSELTWWHSAIPLGVVLLLILGLAGMYVHGFRVAWLLRHGVWAAAQRGAPGHESDLANDDIPSMITRHEFEVNGQTYLTKKYSPANKAIAGDEIALLYNPRRPKQNVILSEHLAETIETSRSTASLTVQCAIAPLALIAIYILLRGGQLL